jgi:hypothetical protein
LTASASASWPWSMIKDRVPDRRRHILREYRRRPMSSCRKLTRVRTLRVRTLTARAFSALLRVAQYCTVDQGHDADADAVNINGNRNR